MPSEAKPRLLASWVETARYKLGRGLAEAAPYLLLLSATPHPGKTEQFRRLMSLLDPLVFPDLPAPQSGAVCLRLPVRASRTQTGATHRQARQAGVSSVTKERVQPYVIRTEKRRAIDAQGKPLFNPRRTNPFNTKVSSFSPTFRVRTILPSTGA